MAGLRRLGVESGEAPKVSGHFARGLRARNTRAASERSQHFKAGDALEEAEGYVALHMPRWQLLHGGPAQQLPSCCLPISTLPHRLGFPRPSSRSTFVTVAHHG